MRHTFFGIAVCVVMLGTEAIPARAQQTGGSVFTSGMNDHGQLGNGIVDPSAFAYVPNVGGFTDVIAVAAGAGHSLLLRADGSVWAWGDNSYGQLGDHTYNVSAVPVRALGPSSHVMGIAAGPNYSLAVTSNGLVYAWGDNSHGQLGVSSSPIRPYADLVPGVSNVTMVAAGMSHVLALRTDGSVWAWGDNSRGQLGDGTTSPRTTPFLTTLLNIASIAAGDYHSVAMQVNGTVFVWGDNSCGQSLGGGTIVTSPYPQTSLTSGIQFAENATVVRVSAKGLRTNALTSAGTVWDWGGYPTTPPKCFGFGLTKVDVTDARDFSAGELETAVAKSDGTVWRWNPNLLGSTREGGPHGATMIAAGQHHIVGISTFNPVATLNTASLDFGNKPVGVPSAPMMVTLTNAGDGALEVTNAWSSGGDYKIATPLPITIAPGASASINVYFQPTRTGLRTGTLTIEDNSETRYERVSLVGYGGSPAVSLSTGAISFGNRQLGVAHGPIPVTITNTGGGLLTIAGFTPSSADFYSTTATPLLVQPGGSTSFDVWFKPTGTGPRTATLNVFDNSPTSPEAIALTGYGINPIATITPASLNFGNQQVNTTSTQTLTVSNTGFGALDVTGVLMNGPHSDDFAYTVSPALPLAIQPGQLIVFTVRFTPHAAGARAASLVLYDNAVNSPQTIALAGNGILPADLAVATSATKTSGSLMTGPTLTYSIRVANMSANAAYNAVLTTAVPVGTSLSSVRTSQGACKLGEAGAMTCSLGSIGGSGAATVTLTVNVKSGTGLTISQSATVTSVLDPNSTNNTFTIATVM